MKYILLLAGIFIGAFVIIPVLYIIWLNVYDLLEIIEDHHYERKSRREQAQVEKFKDNLK